MAMSYFPPDEGLRKLAALVNKKLPDGLMVNLYRIEHEDGRSEIGITYSTGSRRTTVRVDGRSLTEHDAPGLIKAATDWGNQPRYEHRWTADPAEAGM